MHRTQLYLEDDVWEALRLLAERQSTSISELVRQAVRDRYLGDKEKRRKAMMAFLGCGRDRPNTEETEQYIRDLRKGDRLERLHGK